MELWFDVLRKAVEEQRRRLAEGQTRRPRIQPDGARLHALAG
jgi:hypothetical protein